MGARLPRVRPIAGWAPRTAVEGRVGDLSLRIGLISRPPSPTTQPHSSRLHFWVAWVWRWQPFPYCLHKNWANTGLCFLQCRLGWICGRVHMAKIWFSIKNTCFSLFVTDRQTQIWKAAHHKRGSESSPYARFSLSYFKFHQSHDMFVYIGCLCQLISNL